MVRFAESHPILFALALYAILNVFQLIWLILLPCAEALVIGLPGKITVCAIIALIMTHMHWWREAGFGQQLTWHTLREYAPALLKLLPAVMLLMMTGTYLDSVHILGWTAVALMTGFSEEAVYRGLSTCAFMKILKQCPVETAQSLHLVGHGVGMDQIHENSEPPGVSRVNQEFQIVGGPVSR